MGSCYKCKHFSILSIPHTLDYVIHCDSWKIGDFFAGLRLFFWYNLFGRCKKFSSGVLR